MKLNIINIKLTGLARIAIEDDVPLPCLFKRELNVN